MQYAQRNVLPGPGCLLRGPQVRVRYGSSKIHIEARAAVRDLTPERRVIALANRYDFFSSAFGQGRKFRDQWTKS